MISYELFWMISYEMLFYWFCVNYWNLNLKTNKLFSNLKKKAHFFLKFPDYYILAGCEFFLWICKSYSNASTVVNFFRQRTDPSSNVRIF